MLLETITVRSPRVNAVAEQITVLIKELSVHQPGISLALYLRDPPTSDLSVHLMWRQQSGYSRHLGLQIAAALSDFGTVDHSQWRPIRSG